MKWIKFQDVASSANTANVVNYIEVDELKYISTTATTVIIHSLGAGANVSLDTTTITCASGEAVDLADMILHNAGHLPHGGIYTVDVDTGTSATLISDISYAAVA
tara:strand:- start:1956 stop:2270 length:315 start_codon:yes stop_codon:yes gene_type:complete